jgi:putative heme-binding domain-containing protein
VEALGRARLSDAQAGRLAGAVRGDALLSPSLWLPALPGELGEGSAKALLDTLAPALERGWSPGEKELHAVLARLPAGLRGKGERLLALRRDADRARRAKLAEFEPLLRGGDPRRGRAVFFGKKVACGSCHRVGDEGGQIGPDLSKVGAIRAGRDLLESVVLPSSTFAQGYETYTVATSSGRVFTGVIARQSPEVVVLRDSAGAETRLPRSAVESMTRQPTSLMPEGLPAALTREEFRDLLAFLQSLK